ncbi:unnamed protein product [Lampetra planeri]
MARSFDGLFFRQELNSGLWGSQCDNETTEPRLVSERPEGKGGRRDARLGAPVEQSGDAAWNPFRDPFRDVVMFHDAPPSRPHCSHHAALLLLSSLLRPTIYCRALSKAVSLHVGGMRSTAVASQSGQLGATGGNWGHGQSGGKCKMQQPQ